MRRLITTLFYCCIVTLLLASPVMAKIPSGECCQLGHPEDCPEGNYVCDKSVDPTCVNQGLGECYLIGSYGPGEGEEEGIFNPVIGILGRQAGEVTVGYLVAAFLRLAYMFGSLMVLVFFIWGAIEWMTAGGDPEAVKRAQARLTNAFIGLALLAGTYLIAVILGTILHINLLEIVLPKPIK